ncbi:hypothetical protein CYY_003943 [Polysphondylium violaceum]|uniref:Mediator of RNA polymerase II transcription subunit 14 n=1 Tax=Polysphondylium violaceum TaxID=133409 RepID=A0A8J4PW10_9MYCE|nr:hypothetical protein CYY_003943 [Polysphondylium violaceum]
MNIPPPPPMGMPPDGMQHDPNGMDPQQQPNNNISLSLVIHRLVEQSYNTLLSLTERLSNCDDLERKKSLVEYLDSTREKFLKLLVLMKWSEHVPTLTKANNIINLLNLEDSYFRDAADLLIHTKYNLINARAPMYDIPTAIDVLTTGTYQRMPTDIKKVIPPPQLKQPQIDSALERLNDIIKYKLFFSEIPKEFEPIQIENGKAHITVKNEYDACLSIDGGSTEKSNWVLLSLNLYIYSKRDLDGEGPIKVAYENQMKAVLERVQNRISSSQQPLHELHNIIHHLCISSQMDILASQVENLKKTILKNNIKCIIGKDQSITVYYWIPEDMNIGNNPNINANHFKIYIDNQKIKIAHYPQITHPKKDNYFNIECLNIGTLLLQAIELNAYHRVFTLYSILRNTESSSSSSSSGSNTVGNINNNTKPLLGSNGNTSLSQLQLLQQQHQQNQQQLQHSNSFHLNDIKLIKSSRFSDENVSSDNQDHLPTVLRIMLYGCKFLDITVNFQNGKFTLIKSSTNYIELTTLLEGKLNSNINEIKSIVNTFKLKSLLSCFEDASLFLGLEYFYKLPLHMVNNSAIIDIFTENNYICVRLPKETELYYLLISIKPNTFVPSFYLLLCKLMPKSTMMSLESIIKLDSEYLSNLLKNCKCAHSNSDLYNFQSEIQYLLGKTVQLSKQKINLLQAESILKKENIKYQSNDECITFFLQQQGNSSSGGSSATTIFTEQSLATLSDFLSPLSPITLNYSDSEQLYHLSFRERPFNYDLSDFDDNLSTTSSNTTINNDTGIVGDDSISTNTKLNIKSNFNYSNGLWNFKYFTTNDWLVNFYHDLVGISKITNIATQLLKQIETNPIYKQVLSIAYIKPFEVDFIYNNEISSRKTLIKIHLDKKNNILLSFQPSPNPFKDFFEKEINQSPTNDISNVLRHIIASDELSNFLNSLTSNLPYFFLPLEIVVVPRSCNQVRLFYKNSYAIDIKLLSLEYCAIEDTFYSSQFNPKQTTRLNTIYHFHTFMEQKTYLQALDNPLGHRTIWSLHVSMLSKTLNRIFIYLHSLNTIKTISGLLKNFFQVPAQSTAAYYRCTSEYYNIAASIRDYQSFEIEVASKDLANNPYPNQQDLAILGQYFKKKMNQLSYRLQTITACIHMLTLPPTVLYDFIRVIVEYARGAYVEIALNTTASINQTARESFIHKKEDQCVFFIVRFLFLARNQPFSGTNTSNSPTSITTPAISSSNAPTAGVIYEQFVDMPTMYCYNPQNKYIQFWDKVNTQINITTAGNQPPPPPLPIQPQPLSSIDESKKSVINTIGSQTINEFNNLAPLSSGTPPNNIISIYIRNLANVISQFHHNSPTPTTTATASTSTSTPTPISTINTNSNNNANTIISPQGNSISPPILNNNASSLNSPTPINK